MSLFLSLFFLFLSGCQERVCGCVFGVIVVRAMRRSSLYFVVMATLATWYPLHVRLKHPISWYFTRSCMRSFLWVLSQHNHVLSHLVWETCTHTMLSNLQRGVNLKAYVWNTHNLMVFNMSVHAMHYIMCIVLQVNYCKNVFKHLKICMFIGYEQNFLRY